MNSYKIHKKLKGYRPLSCDENALYLYKNNSVYEYDFLTDKINFVCVLPVCRFNLMQKLLLDFRLITRVLRLTPTTSIIFNNFLYISFKSIIFKVDIKEKRGYVDFEVPNNRKILNFSIVRICNKSNLVFGEYFSNPEKHSVNLWLKDNFSDGWKAIYSFSDGAINHVHNVVQIEDRILILTGDFGDASAIWEYDFNSSVCSPLLSGSQIFRATWISNIDNAYYYATDSQIDENFLISLDQLNTSFTPRKISSLPGSSIYCGVSSNKDELLFSTSVECGEPTENSFTDLFSCTPGSGIKSNNSYIFKYDLTNKKLMEVFKLKKDFLPFRLFQFGSFIFPSGVMPKNRIIAYCNALEKFDNCTLIFKA